MRYGHRQTLDPDCVRAIAAPQHRAGPASPGAKSSFVSAIRGPSTIAGPSRSFIELTRNIELAEQAPWRFEPTMKGENDVVI